MKQGLIAMLLAGCSTMPNYSNMLPDQIKEQVKDKSIIGVCSHIPTPWGIAFVNVLAVDQSVIHNGKVSSTEACAIVMEEATKPPVTRP